MKAEFWHERWEKNQIGFHQSKVNTHLQDFWGRLQLPVGGTATVFVPLCGKSSDMLWLRSQGCQVLGIELNRIAVRDFFAENNLQPEISQHGALERWQADGIVIFCGDFFALTTADVTQCHAIFDRAALIALPPEMRPDYIEHMRQLFPAGLDTLLVTLEYDQSIAGGPPFSVPDIEVHGYFTAHYQVDLLRAEDALDDLPGLKKRGVPAVDEKAWLLTVSDGRAQQVTATNNAA